MSVLASIRHLRFSRRGLHTRHAFSSTLGTRSAAAPRDAEEGDDEFLPSSLALFNGGDSGAASYLSIQRAPSFAAHEAATRSPFGGSSLAAGLRELKGTHTLRTAAMPHSRRQRLWQTVLPLLPFSGAPAPADHSIAAVLCFLAGQTSRGNGAVEQEPIAEIKEITRAVLSGAERTALMAGLPAQGELCRRFPSREEVMEDVSGELLLHAYVIPTLLCARELRVSLQDLVRSVILPVYYPELQTVAMKMGYVTASKKSEDKEEQRCRGALTALSKLVQSAVENNANLLGYSLHHGFVALREEVFLEAPGIALRCAVHRRLLPRVRQLCQLRTKEKGKYITNCSLEELWPEKDNAQQLLLPHKASLTRAMQERILSFLVSSVPEFLQRGAGTSIHLVVPVERKQPSSVSPPPLPADVKTSTEDTGAVSLLPTPMVLSVEAASQRRVEHCAGLSPMEVVDRALQVVRSVDGGVTLSQLSQMMEFPLCTSVSHRITLKTLLLNFPLHFELFTVGDAMVHYCRLVAHAASRLPTVLPEALRCRFSSQVSKELSTLDSSAHFTRGCMDTMNLVVDALMVRLERSHVGPVALDLLGDAVKRKPKRLYALLPLLIRTGDLELVEPSQWVERATAEEIEDTLIAPGKRIQQLLSYIHSFDTSPKLMGAAPRRIDASFVETLFQRILQPLLLEPVVFAEPDAMPLHCLEVYCGWNFLKSRLGLFSEFVDEHLDSNKWKIGKTSNGISVVEPLNIPSAATTAEAAPRPKADRESLRDAKEIKSHRKDAGAAVAPPPPPPPPPLGGAAVRHYASLAATRSADVASFAEDTRSYRSKVSKAMELDGWEPLLELLSVTISTLFEEILPSIPVPDGLRLSRLAGKSAYIRKNSQLGTLSSFIRFFEGIFFDLCVDQLSNVDHDHQDDYSDHSIVRIYQGRVSPRLVYARLIVPFVVYALRARPLWGPCSVHELACALQYQVYFLKVAGPLLGLIQHAGQLSVEKCKTNDHVIVLKAPLSSSMVERNLVGKEASLGKRVAPHKPMEDPFYSGTSKEQAWKKAQECRKLHKLLRQVPKEKPLFVGEIERITHPYAVSAMEHRFPLHLRKCGFKEATFVCVSGGKEGTLSREQEDLWNVDKKYRRWEQWIARYAARYVLPALSFPAWRSAAEVEAALGWAVDLRIPEELRSACLLALLDDILPSEVEHEGGHEKLCTRAKMEIEESRGLLRLTPPYVEWTHRRTNATAVINKGSRTLIGEEAVMAANGFVGFPPHFAEEGEKEATAAAVGRWSLQTMGQKLPRWPVSLGEVGRVFGVSAEILLPAIRRGVAEVREKEHGSKEGNVVRCIRSDGDILVWSEFPPPSTLNKTIIKEQNAVG